MRTIPLGELWIWTLAEPTFCDTCSQAIAGRAALEASMRRIVCESCAFDLDLSPLDVHAPLGSAA